MTQNLSNEGTSYDGTIANYVAWQSPSTTPYNEDGSLNDGCGMFGVNLSLSVLIHMIVTM